ncbi:MAG: class I SAM-dependent methyltransferase [Frankiaceae bacterium]|nr:class I SAM-dependent methyltransferase [Frankiaceae bacterium]
MLPPSPVLVEAMERLCGAVVPAGRVVDLGCGPGQDVQELRRRGFCAVGVDLSPAMLRAGARRAGGAFVVGDLRALPLQDRSVDGAWSSYALLHVPDGDLGTALRELHRVLRPGGTAVLVTASAGGGREPVAYAPERERIFFTRTADALVTAARDAGLDVVDAETEPDGWRAPVRMVARRP